MKYEEMLAKAIERGELSELEKEIVAFKKQYPDFTFDGMGELSVDYIVLLSDKKIAVKNAEGFVGEANVEGGNTRKYVFRAVLKSLNAMVEGMED